MRALSNFRADIQTWISNIASAQHVEIISIQPLTGGSIQENWKLICEIKGGEYAGMHYYVLRCDAPSCISASLSRRQEFNILRTVFKAGVTVPEPLWLCEDTDVVGRTFYIMKFIDGVALGPKIVKDQTLGGNRETLTRQLGQELAKIHSIVPPIEALDFLPMPEQHPGLYVISKLRKQLDDFDEPRPMLEWGLRCAELNLPKKPSLTLTHQDYRTGNYLVDDKGLKGILDWEFTAWGDSMSDIAWFCAECWRFSRPDLEAGGIASRQVFYDAYQASSGKRIDEKAVYFWEIVAHVRWAIIALQQTQRHLSGTQPSLELALTGRILPNIENQLLKMTSPLYFRTA